MYFDDDDRDNDGDYVLDTMYSRDQMERREREKKEEDKR